MDFSLLLEGLSTSLLPFNLMLIIVGMLIGVAFGALPGISSSMAIVLMLPFTYYMGIIPSIMLLVAIYTGSAYGGSITAILFNTPGTPEAVATTFDGYPMAQKGQAGRALGLAITASAFGGIFSIFVMLFLSPPLSSIALKIQSAEYFALTFLGIAVISSIGSKDIFKALASGLIGILIALIGIDPIGGIERFTFNSIELMNGLNFIPIMIGAFALGEVLSQVASRHSTKNLSGPEQGKLILTGVKIKDFLQHKWVALKSAVIGTVIGILPGTGGSISSFVSYGVAMRTSKNKDQFGLGCEEGVVAPETSNNAAAGGAMIPTLVLGIPGSPTTAIILAALALQGLQPGPQLMVDQPLLLYCIFFAMLIASLLTFIGGRLGVRAFTVLLKLPYPILATFIIMLSILGAYAVDNNLFNVWIMLIFGVIGYLMKKYDFSPAALVLGLVLGPMMEESFRRQLLVTGGDYMSFVTQPISLVILIFAVISLVFPFLKVSKKLEV
ncbi:tripartite tricarboxylate transporter permease [Sporosarcina sp. 179-K 8C2 HS]|uniref:tripartite tricarboxylate transporter permease n=1 Tax=Sporosarcina sp. 179-K 8C2 HS TaxID=3142387 RepID=UPI0039A05AEE